MSAIIQKTLKVSSQSSFVPDPGLNTLRTRSGTRCFVKLCSRRTGTVRAKQTSHALNESGGPITNPYCVQRTGRGFPNFNFSCKWLLLSSFIKKQQPPWWWWRRGVLEEEGGGSLCVHSKLQQIQILRQQLPILQQLLTANMISHNSSQVRDKLQP